MPIIKTKREDVLRSIEVDRILEGAAKGLVHYRPIRVEPNSVDMILRFEPARIKCLVALLWLFGKRITENLRLKRKDFRVAHKYLYVHYYILKKKHRQAQAIPERKLKRITLENRYTRYILDYVESIREPDAYIFASNRSTTGYMSRNHAYRILKGLDPKCWLHLFRHSVATEMAERGATEEELMAWFDWDRYDTAHGYVKGGPKLTAKWSKRKW